MLMIAIVLILVAVFSSQLADYLPSERSPTVTIRVSNDGRGNITLWHKGGDWVKTGSLRVVVFNQSYRMDDPDHKFILGRAEWMTDQSFSDRTFDLGENITVDIQRPLTEDEKEKTITLATDKAVVFSGTIGGGGS